MWFLNMTKSLKVEYRATILCAFDAETLKHCLIKKTDGISKDFHHKDKSGWKTVLF